MLQNTTATSGTVTIPSTGQNIIIAHSTAEVVAALAFNLTGNARNGQELMIITEKGINSLSVSTATGAVLLPPTKLGPGDSFEIVYVQLFSKWFPKNRLPEVVFDPAVFSVETDPETGIITVGLLDAGASEEFLTIESSTVTPTESPAHTFLGEGAGVFGQRLPAGADAIISFDVPATISDIELVVLGLDVGTSNDTYGAFDYGLHASSDVYKTNSNSTTPVPSAITVVAGHKYGFRRIAGVIAAVYSNDGGDTWLDIFEFPTANNAELAIHYAFFNPSKYIINGKLILL